MINFFNSINRIGEELSEIRGSIEELKLSVESLQGNPMVEFWIPVLSIVASIGVAYLAARISAKATLKSAKEGTRASEKVKTERAKIDAANDWMSSFEQALRNTYHILEACQTISSTHPLQRLMQVQRLGDPSLMLKKNTSSLFHFVQKKGEATTIKKWQQPSYIDGLCMNYNILLSHCSDVIKLVEAIKSAAFERVPEDSAVVEISGDSLIKLFGKSALRNASVSLETSINTARSLAEEFEDFLAKFPQIVKSKLSKEEWISNLMPPVISNHGTMGGLTVKDINIVEVSVEVLADLLGKSVEETRSVVNPNIGLEDNMPLPPDDDSREER